MSHSRNEKSMFIMIVKMLPIFILLGLAPLYIHYYYLELPVYQAGTYNQVTQVHDVFTYGKAQLTYWAGSISAVLVLFELMAINRNRNSKLKGLKSKKIESQGLKSQLLQLKLLKSKVFWMLFTLSCWLILTTTQSIFVPQAVWGAPEKYEGLLVWLCYIAVATHTALLVKDDSYRIWIFRTILGSGLIMTLIGLAQFLEMDLVRQEWFKNMVFPKEVAKSLKFTFEANRVYSTLYNPNFVAMYVATVFPLAVYMIFTESKKVLKGLWLLFSVLLIINLIGAKSSGGILGVGVSLMLAVVLVLIKKFFNQYAKYLQMGVFGCLAILAIGFIVGGFSLPTTKGANPMGYNLKNVEIEGQQATFVYKDKTFTARPNTESLNEVYFYDSNQNKIEIVALDNGKYKLNRPEFERIEFNYGIYRADQIYVNFMIDGVNWPMLIGKEGFRYINSNIALVEMIHSEGLGGYVGNEHFGSKRGFIWSRTLPIILKSPIVGYGADTFALAFPQNDYVMKYQMYENPAIIVDKAHNMFLQLASNFGLPGLILFIVLFAYAIGNLTVQYSRKQQLVMSNDLAILLCLVGYLGAGLFYDSNLHVSPFFYVLLGFGLVSSKVDLV